MAGFVSGTILTLILVTIYCQLSITPLWLVIGINILLFIGITSRMVASMAMMSGIPDLRDRGAFMGLNSSIQQLSGGLAASLAGIIVVQQDEGPLLHYPLLGYVVSVAMLITLFMMYRIHLIVKNDQLQSQTKPK